MQVSILFFGQLCDVIGTNKIVLDDLHDTSSLIKILNNKYPALKESKYIIAVNKNIIFENTSLDNNSIIALMPPYSGG